MISEIPKIRRQSVAFSAILLIISLIALFYYSPTVTGDAIIHLVFAENAANGNWFEFNKGIKSAGSSSPFWTVLGAILWKVGGASSTVYGFFFVNIVSWFLLATLVYLICIKTGLGKRLSFASSIIPLSIPGITQNSVQGMENSFFAVLVLLSVYLFISIYKSDSSEYVLTVALFFISGICLSVRPEGISVFAVVFPLYLYGIREKKLEKKASLATITILSFLFPLAVFSYIYYASTGELLPSSGGARIMAARRGSQDISVGPLHIYLSSITYLLYYLPVFISAISFVLYSIYTRNIRVGQVCIISISILAIGGYTFLTGAAHTSRYLIWVFCLLACTIGWSAKLLVRSNFDTLPRWLFALSMIWIAVGASVELGARMTLLWRGAPMDNVVEAPAERKKNTRRLLNDLCPDGSSRDCGFSKPVGIAQQEVQLRFFVDERINVYSVTLRGGGRAGAAGR